MAPPSFCLISVCEMSKLTDPERFAFDASTVNLTGPELQALPLLTKSPHIAKTPCFR